MINQELIQLAADFSENYLTILPGEYNYGKYCIKYLEKDNTERPKHLDVSIISGKMILSKDKISEYSKDFVFYIIIWMGIHINQFRDYEGTDTRAIEYYLTTSRSKDDVIKGFTKLIVNKTFTELNKRRTNYYQSKLS